MNLKGTSFASFFDFLTQRFGPSAQTQVLMAMPLEHRRTIEAGVLASSWYPVATLVCLADVAKRVLGSRDPHFHQESGRHDAEYGLSGVHRVMLREGGPPEFLRARRPCGVGASTRAGWRWCRPEPARPACTPTTARSPPSSAIG